MNKISSAESSRLVVTYRPVGDLIPDPRNARTHPKRQIDQIRASIEAFGFTNPVLADPEGHIIAGHGRLQAARAMGLAELPVITLSGLSEAQKRALRIADNNEQAAAFAMQIKDKYKFSSDSADPYQTVKDWLLRYLSITRGLVRNAEGEGKMSGNEKSTDPGLSAAARKTLRSRQAEEAMPAHE